MMISPSISIKIGIDLNHIPMVHAAPYGAHHYLSARIYLCDIIYEDEGNGVSGLPTPITGMGGTITRTGGHAGKPCNG